VGPLEAFVRDYVEVAGGAWDEIEPQVYDLLLPAAGTDAAEREVVRIAFDPEALPEHPGAQLASYGTPLIDRVLVDAVDRGRYGRLYVVGLNLSPHDLAGLVRRSLTLPAESTLKLEQVRPLHFAQAVFWFQATFVSDQKEQEVLPVALDLHYGRQVRHLDQLLDHARLSQVPSLPLAEARRLSLAAAHPVACDAVLPTVAALANIRGRDVAAHVERQLARMRRYYADLRTELEEQVRRAGSRGEDLSRFAGRRDALDREERFRTGELRQKSSLRVQLRLLTLLQVQQPKLLVRAGIVDPRRAKAALELVWDPLTAALEAAPCPICGRPTFAWAWTRQGALVCPACATAAPAKASRHGR
jgi:hypothetical protein